MDASEASGPCGSGHDRLPAEFAAAEQSLTLGHPEAVPRDPGGLDPNRALDLWYSMPQSRHRLAQAPAALPCRHRCRRSSPTPEPSIGRPSFTAQISRRGSGPREARRGHDHRVAFDDRLAPDRADRRQRHSTLFEKDCGNRDCCVHRVTRAHRCLEAKVLTQVDGPWAWQSSRDCCRDDAGRQHSMSNASLERRGPRKFLVDVHGIEVT